MDLTPRELRVPTADTETHTNTALGISHVHLSVPADTFSQVKAQLSVVLDSRFDETSTEWELALPQFVRAITRAPRLRLSVAEPGVTTSSIDEIGFFVSRPKEQVDTPKGFGKVVFVDV
ncbi:hypothetical protein RhiJN_28904 [Ceratobasidium sp. AG-Ba]|nr:hypothetical protein RhiJN_28904 [Ceratobasidium sp. AG-Ba]